MLRYWCKLVSVLVVCDSTMVVNVWCPRVKGDDISGIGSNAFVSATKTICYKICKVYTKNCRIYFNI